MSKNRKAREVAIYLKRIDAEMRLAEPGSIETWRLSGSVKHAMIWYHHSGGQTLCNTVFARGESQSYKATKHFWDRCSWCQNCVRHMIALGRNPNYVQ